MSFFELPGKNPLYFVKMLSVSGDCPEPGGIPGGIRRGGLPAYRVGDQVVYECREGFNGTGGNITCQQNGKWTEKPDCKGEQVEPKNE